MIRRARHNTARTGIPAPARQSRPCAARSFDGPLAIGRAGDAHEQEADRVADRVAAPGASASPAPLAAAPAVIQRAGAAPLAAPAHPAATRAGAAVSASGHPLPAAERAYFEPFFRRDLSAVRLHTDRAAADAARGINARAYTLRNHIAFAPGEYAPGTAGGRRLLAHELTHTLQQGNTRTIRRTCPTDPTKIPKGGSADFEKEVGEIHTLKPYKRLDNAAARRSKSSAVRNGKATADHIIDGARGSACPMYYITKLRLLFDTGEASSAKTGAKFRGKAKAAASKEGARLERQRKSSKALGLDENELANVEEDLTASSMRRMRTAKGRQNKTFLIDDQDVTDIYVHMKVLPRPAKRLTKRRKKQAAEDVKRTKGLEDGIEVAVLTSSYTLNLEFVSTPGPDVFEVVVNPETWPTAGNWISTAGTLAHEAHHLLGLQDRYNYIESHAGNENMKIPVRLHWFREQMVRAFDPLAEQSKMMRSSSKEGLNPQDICALVQSDYRTCLVKRFALEPAHDIEKTAKGLNAPYRPQHAALLDVLTRAWSRRPPAELTANCTASDPKCGQPPEPIFGDPAKIASDKAAFPLANPHKQPSGSSLKRKARVTP